MRLLSNLANLPLRGPVLLARVATTLDAVSDGRFELGVAGGAQQLWASIVADGGPARNAGESIEALDEAVQIIRSLWYERSPITFLGTHYRVDGATTGPGACPLHRPLARRLSTASVALGRTSR